MSKHSSLPGTDWRWNCKSAMEILHKGHHFGAWGDVETALDRLQELEEFFRKIVPVLKSLNEEIESMPEEDK